MALHKDQQKLPTLQMKVIRKMSSSLIKQQKQGGEEDRLQHSKNTPNSNTCPSFRVYYGGVSVAIPFVWESKPGTPKHQSNSDYSNSSPPPPLTPPPSYYRQTPADYSITKDNLMIMKSRPNKSSSLSLLSEFCKKLITINRHRKGYHPDRKTTSTRRSLATVYDLRVNDDDDDDKVEVINSHTSSTLCFWR